MQGLLFWAMDFWVSLRYVSVDSLKNKKNFCIAVVTIIIAVAAIVYARRAARLLPCFVPKKRLSTHLSFLASALTAIVAKSPLVFVKLAENTVGEYDLVRFLLPFSRERNEQYRTGQFADDLLGIQLITPDGTPIGVEPRSYDKYGDTA